MEDSALEALSEFCSDQFAAFNPEAWTNNCAIDSASLTVAAKYLSMTSWYGHENGLERVLAKTETPKPNGLDFHHDLQAAGLDLAAFSARVRSKIALRRIRRFFAKDSDGLTTHRMLGERLGEQPETRRRIVDRPE